MLFIKSHRGLLVNALEKVLSNKRNLEVIFSRKFYISWPLTYFLNQSNVMNPTTVEVCLGVSIKVVLQFEKMLFF